MGQRRKIENVGAKGRADMSDAQGPPTLTAMGDMYGHFEQANFAAVKGGAKAGGSQHAGAPDGGSGGGIMPGSVSGSCSAAGSPGTRQGAAAWPRQEDARRQGDDPQGARLMPGVPRFDRNGRPIPPGPAFGAAMRQTWETDAERDERLTPDESPYPQADGGEAVQAILADVEQRREELRAEEDSTLHPEQAEDFVSRAVAATNYAAGKVVEANETRTPTLEAQHREHLLAAYNGNLSDDDAQDLYETGVGLPPDAAEHAALLAELEGDDDEDVSASDDDELEDW
jgi:hypothetical protein